MQYDHGPTLGNGQHFRDPERRAIDILFFASLIAFSCQGLLNFIVAGTAADSWKQALACVLILSCPAIIRSKNDIFLFAFVAIVTVILIISSLMQQLTLYSIIFNSFFYICWLPFYIWGRSISDRSFSRRFRIAALAIISISCVGMLIQFYTPYLDFLDDSLSSIDYTPSDSEARRLAFVFVASTLVMPTLVGFFRLLHLFDRRTTTRLSCFLMLAATAIPTGSLGSVVMLGGAAAMLISNSTTFQKMFVVVLGGCIIYHFMLGDDAAQVQLGRVMVNDLTSDSNLGRIALWHEAIAMITQFDVREQFFGAGLGATNGNHAGTALTLIHGESSFFQAYIEGGLAATLLRLTPFVLVFTGKAGGRQENLFYAGALLLCCGTAPLFGSFSIQCTLGLLAGLANNDCLTWRPAETRSEARLRAQS